MRTNILSRQTLLITVLIGYPIILAFALFSDIAPLKRSALIIENLAVIPDQEQSAPTQKQPSFGLPIRLKISAINVDSAVEDVGLAPDGAMDVPKDQNDVAWLEIGWRPGENGSAVIAGHYGWKDGKPSVFDNLYKLRKGDKLQIEDDRGVIITFIVRESRRYDPNADASVVFGSTDNQSHLNLVTCEGAWDKSAQQYPERLVVFTDKEAD